MHIFVEIPETMTTASLHMFSNHCVRRPYLCIFTQTIKQRHAFSWEISVPEHMIETTHEYIDSVKRLTRRAGHLLRKYSKPI